MFASKIADRFDEGCYPCFGPLKPGAWSHLYQVGEFIQLIRLMDGILHCYSNFYIPFCKRTVKENDQTLHYALTDLGLQCLQSSHTKDDMLNMD